MKTTFTFIPATRSCIQLLLCFALIFITTPAYALYYLSYTVDPNNTAGNSNLALNTDGFSLSDVYNRYSGSTWEVASAVDDGNGGVNVSYNLNQDPWDSYGAEVHFSFQILSDDGNLDPELISVNARGELDYEHEVNFGPYPEYSAACCFGSSAMIEGPMASLFGFGETASATFGDTYGLYTNTTYDMWYSVEHYVESWIRDLPLHFDTLAEFEAFIADTSGFGGSYASAQGAAYYSLGLGSNASRARVSVPEPPIMILLTIGLAGFFGIRKKLKT